MLQPGVNIYKIVVTLCAIYMVISCLLLAVQNRKIGVLDRICFVPWSISTQSSFIMFAAIVKIGINAYLLIPILSFCLGIIVTVKILEDY